MENLKRSSSVLILIISLAIGCQSNKSFQITTDEKKELHIIEIDTNRITQECYFMNAEKENNWRHQYVLHILNKQNEVISLYNPTNQGKQECLAHLNKVRKILKKELRVKLCARDILEKRNNKEVIPETLDFGPLGKHKSPYNGITFDSICNSKECYSISDTWTYTCPALN